MSELVKDEESQADDKMDEIIEPGTEEEILARLDQLLLELGKDSQDPLADEETASPIGDDNILDSIDALIKRMDKLEKRAGEMDVPNIEEVAQHPVRSGISGMDGAKNPGTGEMGIPNDKEAAGKEFKIDEAKYPKTGEIDIPDDKEAAQEEGVEEINKKIELKQASIQSEIIEINGAKFPGIEEIDVPDNKEDARHGAKGANNQIEDGFELKEVSVPLQISEIHEAKYPKTGEIDIPDDKKGARQEEGVKEIKKQIELKQASIQSEIIEVNGAKFPGIEEIAVPENKEDACHGAKAAYNKIEQEFELKEASVPSEIIEMPEAKSQGTGKMDVPDNHEEEQAAKKIMEIGEGVIESPKDTIKIDDRKDQDSRGQEKENEKLVRDKIDSASQDEVKLMTEPKFTLEQGIKTNETPKDDTKEDKNSLTNGAAVSNEDLRDGRKGKQTRKMPKRAKGKSDLAEASQKDARITRGRIRLQQIEQESKLREAFVRLETCDINEYKEKTDGASSIERDQGADEQQKGNEEIKLTRGRLRALQIEQECRMREASVRLETFDINEYKKKTDGASSIERDQGADEQQKGNEIKLTRGRLRALQIEQECRMKEAFVRLEQMDIDNLKVTGAKPKEQKQPERKNKPKKAYVAKSSKQRQTKMFEMEPYHVCGSPGVVEAPKEYFEGADNKAMEADMEIDGHLEGADEKAMEADIELEERPSIVVPLEEFMAYEGQFSIEEGELVIKPSSHETDEGNEEEGN